MALDVDLVGQREMNLLFVTATLPYPPTDGVKIRIWSLLRRLQRRHRMTVLSLVGPTDDIACLDELRGQGLEVVAIPRASHYAAANLVRGAVGSVPFPILNYETPRMTDELTARLARNAYDVIQVENLHVAQYALSAKVPTVLDLFGVESAVMARYAERAGHPLRRAYAGLTARKLARYERQVCPRFTACLAVSDEDRRLLQGAGIEKVTVIPNGVDVEAFQPDPACEVAGRLVFTGRMDYHANVDGMAWFCREIWPRVRAARPNLQLQIVGGHPTPEVQQLARHPGVEVTGFVKDVRPYLAQATVAVVPLRVGGGTRLKILEMLAMGKTVVSTSIGAEGLAVSPGRELLIGDGPEGFAAQIERGFADPALRQRLATAGRRLVETEYDWEAIARRLEDVYADCLERADRNNVSGRRVVGGRESTAHA
jgi:sugar transferase (PEP-CTERM/EpsH1 system associated)